MSGFSAEWLALRADADRRARNPRLAGEVTAHFQDRAGLRIVDLGAGTGANLHATSLLLSSRQHWRLIDHDPVLLSQAHAPEDGQVEARVMDLSGPLDALWTPVPDLVTASAFFDLCGADWIDRFLDGLAETGAAFYTVLTYDGREDWRPRAADDAAALAAFHAHQRSDKGLGPSLGPDAHAYLRSELAARGYKTLEGNSDWSLEAPRDAALIRALAAGSAEAIAPALGTARAKAWARHHRGAREVVIGHQDLFAWRESAAA